MKDYLFILTIGPVQSFIAQARKGQDLYAGSQILSRLVKTGILHFIRQKNANVIFPIINEKEENASLPNRFLGKINLSEDDARQQLSKLGKELKSQIEKEFVSVSQRSLEKISKRDFSADFLEQIERHLDIHWAALPMEVSYKDTYEKLEQLLGSVKNIRPFEQLNDGEGEKGRKCALDGENNVLFYPNEKDSPLAKSLKKQGAQRVHNSLLNPGEAVSAVSMVKRLYKRNGNNQGFPSVAEIALLKAQEQIQGKKAESCLQDYINLCSGKKEFVAYCLKNGENFSLTPNDFDNLNTNFDYQLIYPENVTDKNFPNKLQKEYATELAKRLKGKLKDKHYALILFDGDNMGSWLSGNNTEHDENELENFHGKLSETLSEYAKSVARILEGRGKVIYSGGDDFLGMVNLHYLFDVMRELRTRFFAEVSEKIQQKKSEKHLTFSAGIVIAHYKTPLSEVLSKVRSMEGKAKKIGNRNAFALAVIKHSGEIQETVFKWDENESDARGCSNWNDIDTVFTHLQADNFSNKFITTLTRELYSLTGAGFMKLNNIRYAIETETERLIKKAKIDNSTNSEELIESVKRLLKNSVEDKQSENFIHALQIADFMSRKLQKS